MARVKPIVAISYDFDGTLAPGNMQEHSFIPDIGLTKNEFWNDVDQLCKAHDADNILVYMSLMLEKANAARVPVRKRDFKARGKDLQLFTGVDEWFDRINQYGKESGIAVEHYIISSGIREIVEGTKIARKFKRIFASSFRYDHNDVAAWPALALNYTTKTQYLFRINKGTLDVFDHSMINKYVPKNERPIPFENMIFIGDGETDIPCFRLVKDQGGHSVAVYQSRKHGARQRAKALQKVGRVNFVAPADYSDGKVLDKIVKAIIDKIQHEADMSALRFI